MLRKVVLRGAKHAATEVGENVSHYFRAFCKEYACFVSEFLLRQSGEVFDLILRKHEPLLLTSCFDEVADEEEVARKTQQFA